MIYADLIERADALQAGHPELAELEQRIAAARLGLRAGHQMRAGPIGEGDAVMAQVETLDHGRQWADLVELAHRAIAADERARQQRGEGTPTARCRRLVSYHNRSLLLTSVSPAD